MEEKERYEVHIYDDVCVDLYNNGVLDKSINDTYKLEKLFNQQSRRIKDLEAKNVEIIEREDEELIANIITYKKMLIKENNWVAFGKEIFEQTYKIVMYVPKGSVKITYNVSL